MVALRALSSFEDGERNAFATGEAHTDDDWLTLPQAACEMGVSISTVRRLLRSGRLRNRIIPRRGGFKYLIYMPGNRHRAGALHLCDADPDAPIDIMRVRQQREIGRLERQVEELSGALSRALRSHQHVGAATRRPRRRHAAGPVRPLPMARPQAPLVAVRLTFARTTHPAYHNRAVPRGISHHAHGATPRRST